MKFITHILYTFTLVWFVCSPSYATKETALEKLGKFVSNIDNFTKTFPQEKVYLHFDNTGYYLGETIWFKGYVATSTHNKPTQLSRVLYVDFLNPEGYVIESKKLKIEDGQAHGDFYITDTLNSGFFEVRAYTQYMLNMSEDYMFSRVFPVYSKPAIAGDYLDKAMVEREKQGFIELVDADAKEKENNPYTISFFPEGGNLVKGLSSKIAFKATDESGKDMNITGQIWKRDKNGKKDEIVSSFATAHDGMGAFELRPDGSEYIAEFIYNNQAYNAGLPSAEERGYVLGINNLNDQNITIKIQKSENLPVDTIGLLISCRGKIMVFNTLKIPEEPVITTLEKDILPDGVNQVILLDKNGTIYAERMIFIKHENFLQYTVKTSVDKTDFEPHEKLNVSVETTDREGNPTPSSLSISIRDKLSEETTYSNDNLLSNLLLSSELRGFIKNPLYYLKNDDVKSRYALDLLLMTQGWVRYPTDVMKHGTDGYSLAYKIEKGIGFSGTAYTAPNKLGIKKILPNVQLKSWAMNDSLYVWGTEMADEEGRFKFYAGDISGKFSLTIQTNEQEKKGKYKGMWLKRTSNIILDRHPYFEPKEYNYYEINLPDPPPDTDEKSQQEAISGSMMEGLYLPEVTVSEKRKKSLPIEHYPPALVIDMQDEMDLQIDLYEWEQDACMLHSARENPAGNRNMNIHSGGFGEIVPADPCASFFGHAISWRLCIPSLTSTRFKYTKLPSNTRMYYLDYVERIELYTDRSLRDKKAYKRPHQDWRSDIVYKYVAYENDYSRPRPEGMRHTKLHGYNVPKEFYNPDYSNSKLPEKPDFRRTLYWNPDIKTDENGKASITFYNNSKCERISVSAEGWTQNGVPIVNE